LYLSVLSYNYEILALQHSLSPVFDDSVLGLSWEGQFLGVGFKNRLLYRVMHYSAKYYDCMSSVRLSVCLSVALVDQEHIGWQSWKLIAQTIRPTSSLFVAQRPSTYSKREF